MTTLKANTCPTCGGNHPPGAHHRPQTVAQRPPQLPGPEVRSREQDAADDPAADDGEEQPSVGERSKNGNEDEEDAEEGEANNRVGVRSGVAPNNKVGVRPRVAPNSRSVPEITVAPNPGVATQPRVAPNSQPATALPPPPEGAPAGTWDFYLRTLPAGAEGRRKGARSQIREALADLDHGQRVEEGRKYAHSAEERQFLEYTGYLPTLDEETDARIMAQERARRAAIAAARRARAAYQKTRSEYRETFIQYTGKQSTGSKARDAEIWKAETDRRKDVYATEFRDYTGKDPTFDPVEDSTIWQAETDRRKTTPIITEMDTPADVAESLVTAASPTLTTPTLVDTGPTPTVEGPETFTYTVTGTSETAGADGSEGKGSLVQQGLASSPYSEIELYRLEFKDYTGEESTGDYDQDTLIWQKATDRKVGEAVKGLPQDLQADYSERVLNGASTTDAYSAVVLTFNTRVGERKAASDRELTEAINGLPQDLQDDYFQRVKDGADPFEAYNTVAGIASTRVGERKAASDRELTEAVNGLPQDLQDDYFQRVMDGADPFDAYSTVAGIANSRVKEQAQYVAPGGTYIASGTGGDLETQNRPPRDAYLDYGATTITPASETLEEDLAFHNNKTLREWQTANSAEAVAMGYGDDLNTGSNTASESRLQTIDGENFYEVIGSMPEVVYAGGERKTWAELFPHTEDSKTGARLRRDMEGTGLTDYDAATVREWLNSGYLSLSDNKAPDVAIIEKPLPDVSAYYQTPSTSDSEAHKRFNEAHATFDQQIADAKAAGKVIIVQNPLPLGDPRRGAFLAELIPAVGLIKAYIEARGPGSDGGTAITERERNSIAFELALTAADIMPIPATKAFSVGGRIARTTKALLPTGPDAIARRYDALVSRDMNQGGYLGRLTVGELPSDARVANTFYKDVDRFSKSGLVSTEDAVALAAQKRSFTPEQLAEIRDPGGLSKRLPATLPGTCLIGRSAARKGCRSRCTAQLTIPPRWSGDSDLALAAQQQFLSARPACSSRNGASSRRQPSRKPAVSTTQGR